MTAPVVEDDIDEVTGISAGLSGQDLTITLTRDAPSPDLTTTITLPTTGGGTPPASTSATITRFDISGQDTSILAGTTLTGTKTFDFNVNHPEDVNGNLTLQQGGVTLRSDIDPTANSFTQAITDVTINNNQQVVFRLSGETNEGVLITAFFRVRAHLPAERLYFGTTSSNDPATRSASI